MEGWIIPSPAGGFADAAFRPIGQRLQQRLGQPFESKPGASGLVLLLPTLLVVLRHDQSAARNNTASEASSSATGLVGAVGSLSAARAISATLLLSMPTALSFSGMPIS